MSTTASPISAPVAPTTSTVSITLKPISGKPPIPVIFSKSSSSFSRPAERPPGITSVVQIPAVPPQTPHVSQPAPPQASQTFSPRASQAISPQASQALSPISPQTLSPISPQASQQAISPQASQTISSQQASQPALVPKLVTISIPSFAIAGIHEVSLQDQAPMSNQTVSQGQPIASSFGIGGITLPSQITTMQNIYGMHKAANSIAGGNVEMNLAETRRIITVNSMTSSMTSSQYPISSAISSAIPSGPSASRLGTYSKVTSKTQAWLATPVTTSATSKSKSKGKGKVIPIVNPNFEAYSTLVDDDEWIKRFKSASIGKLPRGFTFKGNKIDLGGTLSCKKGNKIHRIDLSPNVQEGCSQCKEFFTKMGIAATISDADKTRKVLDDYFRQQDENVPTRWAEIKKAKVKLNLLNNYYDSLARNLGYNADEKLRMIHDFNTGFLLGQLNNDNVHLFEGRIGNITGVAYDPMNHRIILLNAIKLKKPAKKPECQIYSPFAVSWCGLVYYIESQNPARKPGKTFSGLHGQSGTMILQGFPSASKTSGQTSGQTDQTDGQTGQTDQTDQTVRTDQSDFRRDSRQPTQHA